jgi:hypothetical protein
VAKQNLDDLTRELKEWGRRFPALRDDALFVAWFLRAYVTDDERTAVDAVTGGAGDKGVDAVLVDDKVKAVFVVQGKLRQSLMKGAEGRGDVLGFAQLAHTLSSDDGEWESYTKKIAPEARHRLETARERLINRDYRLHLCFVTTGRISEALVTEARRKVRSAPTNCDDLPQLTALDGREVMALLREYLDGVAPPVPALDLAVEDRGSRRTDPATGITSWTVSISGEEVAKLYKQAGVRLFARNIRGYLGENTKVNEEMQKTIRVEPTNFWYLNNGITIVCNGARFESGDGRDLLNVTYPQVINGQQTTRTLAAANPKEAAKASVAVRVISIPRDNEEQYDRLVSQIVRATNWQNAIKASDLMANDPRQIQLEREFRKLNYLYVRKRQVQSEARSVSYTYTAVIKKEDLANAVGACIEESLPRRVGKEPLFDDYYNRVFSRSFSISRFLCCYWHYTTIDRLARGNPQRQWAKFVVVYFLWQEFGAEIRSAAETFRLMSEAPWLYSQLNESYRRLIEIAFDSALRYYRQNRGRGADAVEISPFFKRQDVYAGFEVFWASKENASLRKPFESAAARFRANLAEGRKGASGLHA